MLGSSKLASDSSTLHEAIRNTNPCGLLCELPALVYKEVLTICSPTGPAAHCLTCIAKPFGGSERLRSSRSNLHNPDATNKRHTPC